MSEASPSPESNRLGAFRIQVIHAGTYLWDAGSFFGVVPKTMWSRRMTPDEANRLRFAFNCCIIETGNDTVLIETGVGNRLAPTELSRMGMPEQLPALPELLAAHGVHPGSIDLVINTHLHFDHCGGNTLECNGRYEPAFPGTRYVTQRREWEHAHERHVRDAVSYRDSNYDPLVASGQMELLDGDVEILPGIRLEVVPGHNRDMMIVKACSEGETFCFFSDLVPTTHHVKPTWIAAFDLDPITAIDNKARLLKQAAEENWLCAYAHDADTRFSRIANLAAGPAAGKAQNERSDRLEAVECQQ